MAKKGKKDKKTRSYEIQRGSREDMLTPAILAAPVKEYTIQRRATA